MISFVYIVSRRLYSFFYWRPSSLYLVRGSAINGCIGVALCFHNARARDSRVYNAKLIELILVPVRPFGNLSWDYGANTSTKGRTFLGASLLPSCRMARRRCARFPLSSLDPLAPWAQQSLPVSINTALPVGSPLIRASTQGDRQTYTTLSP